MEVKKYMGENKKYGVVDKNKEVIEKNMEEEEKKEGREIAYYSTLLAQSKPHPRAAKVISSAGSSLHLTA